MDIVFTRDEKRTFYSFLALFLGFSLILIIIIAWLFFKMQYNLHLDLITSKMQTNASKLSSRIIYAHMQNIALDKSDLSVDDGFKFALFDDENQSMIDHIGHEVDLSKKIFKTKDNHLGVVDSSTLGHMGVYHVVVEYPDFQKKIDTLLKQTIVVAIALYIIIVLIGYYLATIFIKPIQHQREKLNNFIKDSTHELNTPITALLMSIGGKKPLSEKSLKRIEISTKRISEIYRDLTYLFLRPPNEKQEIKELNLTKILKRQYSYLEEFAFKKRIAMSLKSDDVVFKIDEESFVRLVNNLLLNAIKYSKIGSKIEIELTKEYLKIKDEGIGIDKKEIKDIFNRFHRATSTQGGFGIGLSIVDSICKSYNIKIDVKSKIAHGTTFTLTFPSS